MCAAALAAFRAHEKPGRKVMSLLAFPSLQDTEKHITVPVSQRGLKEVRPVCCVLETDTQLHVKMHLNTHTQKVTVGSVAAAAFLHRGLCWYVRRRAARLSGLPACESKHGRVRTSLYLFNGAIGVTVAGLQRNSARHNWLRNDNKHRPCVVPANLLVFSLKPGLSRQHRPFNSISVPLFLSHLFHTKQAVVAFPLQNLARPGPARFCFYNLSLALNCCDWQGYSSRQQRGRMITKKDMNSVTTQTMWTGFNVNLIYSVWFLLSHTVIVYYQQHQMLIFTQHNLTGAWKSLAVRISLQLLADCKYVLTHWYYWG